MSDIHQRILNALAILESPKSREMHQVPRTVGLAIDTLRGAGQALRELEESLEIVSAPDLKAAQEVQRLRKEFAAASEKVARLERELQTAREELALEQRVQADERKKLSTLEQKVQKFDQVMLQDDQAFGRYMEHELGKGERKPGKTRG